ncbi:hypothetical protein K2173_017053 [Erythroxylum novogranatense]|uniref:Uncharacterized protein n=1 Tax=Erythroxylum novogranatense TaxID=1862640 RepID=A0AAV8U5K1_9ROSI|nr:hypothetical protein K2173_017053 [Erythroxylum novogranatense]
MGTKVHCESYFQEHFPMKDLTEDSSSCSWPLHNGDKILGNGQYYNGFLPRAVADAYPGYDKDLLKRTMLEHEATFKHQLYELHRLYQIQKDLMNEAERKEQNRDLIRFEGSLSSPLVSQITFEDARKLHISSSFPLGNSACARPSASGIDDIHSPLSSMKGSSFQASPLPSQNGGTSKDVEIIQTKIIETTPTKVRRKMIDLQLPADEYIDTEEEQLRDDDLSGISSYLTNKNHKIASEGGTSLFRGDYRKNDCQPDILQSKSYLRHKSNVADLNEPVEVEEVHASACADILGCTTSHGKLQRHEATNPQSKPLGLSKDIQQKMHLGYEIGTLNSLSSHNDPNSKCWFSHMLVAGSDKNSLKSVSQSLKHEKLGSSSHQVQFLLNNNQEQAKLYQTYESKIDKSRGRLVNGSEHSERNHEMSNSNRPESFITSHLHSPYNTASINLEKPWSHSISPWDRPSRSLNQAQTRTHLNSSATLSSSQSSSQSQGIFGERWNYSSNAACNPSFQNEMPKKNGFYHGSSSGSNEPSVCLPSGKYDYLNCHAENNLAPEKFVNRGSTKFHDGSSFTVVKSVKDVNLNAVPLNSSSNNPNPRHSHELIDIERIPDDSPGTLPWLWAKPTRLNEVTDARFDLNTCGISSLQSSVDQLSDADETRKGQNHITLQNLKSPSGSNIDEALRNEISESPSCKKLLGFPIFGKSDICKNESSSFTSPSVSLRKPSEGEAENKRQLRILDINLPCDPAVHELSQQIAPKGLLTERESDAKVVNFRCEIDLNSCMSEDEASLVPSVPGSNTKIISGIDLEAPVILNTDEVAIFEEEHLEKLQGESLQLKQYKAGSLQDELVRVAVEAIVAISFSDQWKDFDGATGYPSEASGEDPLQWFADIASSCGDDIESKIDATLKAKDGGDNERCPEAIDSFESMILNLIETKKEDYMPRPLVPENLNLEETGITPLPTRTRKGQARRGRQRRDFQRDILPGLTSLSRHEVTEDLQTFGGLMRATGHQWHSGLLRRNSARGGGARGRRRLMTCPSPAVTVTKPCAPLIQQLINIEVGLEDRHLTGWGKTTRRPRRQRCPAGNHPPVALI